MLDIWTAGLDWDDPLPKTLLGRWHNWVNELQHLSSFEIPRCLRHPSPDEIELHMFSDASKDAYAACAYLVCRYEGNTPTSVLIASKSRVAPVKSMTIPRLELMGGYFNTFGKYHTQVNCSIQSDLLDRFYERSILGEKPESQFQNFHRQQNRGNPKFDKPRTVETYPGRTQPR